MDGLTPDNMMSLPPTARALFRLILRNPDMTYDEIRLRMGQQPEEKRLEGDDLDISLEMLCERKWLIRSDEGESSSYSINFQRKQSGIRSKVTAELLNIISDENGEDGSDSVSSEESNRATRSRPPSGLFDTLMDADKPANKPEQSFPGHTQSLRRTQEIKNPLDDLAAPDDDDTPDDAAQTRPSREDKGRSGGLLGFLRRKPKDD